MNSYVRGCINNAAAYLKEAAESGDLQKVEVARRWIKMATEGIA